MSDGHGSDSVADVELGLDKGREVHRSARDDPMATWAPTSRRRLPAPSFNNMGGFTGVYDIPAIPWST